MLQDQNFGLQPTGGPGFNFTIIDKDLRYRIGDVFYASVFSPMCEAPLVTAASQGQKHGENEPSQI